MLRYVIFCATLSLMLLSALAPLQAQSSSGCESTAAAAVEDVCLAPGATSSPRVPAKKACHTCTFVEHVVLPEGPGVTVPMRAAPHVIHATGRVISPDRRPPRA